MEPEKPVEFIEMTPNEFANLVTKYMRKSTTYHQSFYALLVIFKSNIRFLQLWCGMLTVGFAVMLYKLYGG